MSDLDLAYQLALQAEAERLAPARGVAPPGRSTLRKGLVTVASPLQVDGVPAVNITGGALPVDTVVWMLIDAGRRLVIGRADESGGTGGFAGPVTITGAGYREHLKLVRPGTPEVDVTPNIAGRVDVLLDGTAALRVDPTYIDAPFGEVRSEGYPLGAAKLGEVTPTGTSATLTVPSGWTHVEVRGNFSHGATGVNAAALRLNGNSDTRYRSQHGYRQGTTPSHGGNYQDAATNGWCAITHSFSTTVTIRINNAGVAQNLHEWHATGWSNGGASSVLFECGGRWNHPSSGRVTSITLFPPSGSFSAARFTLYGYR